MPKKAQYSNKYGYNISNIQFDCGGQSPSRAAHGTLTTEGIDGAKPTQFTAERCQTAEEATTATGDATASEGRSKYRAPSEPRNPLDPQYKLPTVPPPTYEVPPFIRDTLDISDIEGSHACGPETKEPTRRAHDSLSTADIEGGQPRKTPSIAGHQHQHQHHHQAVDKLNVSDIATKVKKPHANSSSSLQHQHDAGLEDGVGRRLGDVEWQRERNQALRQKGTATLVKTLSALETLAEQVAHVDNAALSALEVGLKTIDREKSGFVHPKELHQAMVQHAGVEVPPMHIKAVASAFSQSSGMIAYHDFLTKIYDRKQGVTAPGWYVARQRRGKTEAAQAMRDVEDTHGDFDTVHATAAHSMKEKGKRKGDVEQRAQHNVESYWFAETSSHSTVHMDGGGGGAPAPQQLPKEGLWFSKEGDDLVSQKAMEEWKPTQDAAIVFDLRKERNKQKENERTVDATATVPASTSVPYSKPMQPPPYVSF